MLSSPPHHYMCYLISQSPSAEDFRELFDCPSYDKSLHLHFHNQIIYVFLVSWRYVTRITTSTSHLLLPSAPNHEYLKLQPNDTVPKRYFRPPASSELVIRTRDWKKVTVEYALSLSTPWEHIQGGGTAPLILHLRNGWT